MSEVICMTRQQLYDLVWTEPVPQLAKKYGMTDYQWRQLCIRMSIPLPRQEHWRKLRAGVSTTRPPLPIRYTGQAFVQLTVASNPSSPKIKASAVASNNPAPRPIKALPEDPLVASVRHQLQHADKRWTDNGLVWTKGKLFPVGVAQANIERACNFLSAFLQAIKHRGYRIEVKQEETVLHIGYQPLPILLRERTKRVLPTDKKNSWTSYELVPSGHLHLHVAYRLKERDWRIGTGAMSDEAEAMVDRLETASGQIDAYYRELEAGWARNAERQRIEQERTERRAAELTGFKRLLQAATRWQQAEHLRAYLLALEQHATRTGNLSPERIAWFTWARAKADWYDPLMETPDAWLAHINRDTLS